ncbi:MAG TPA: hypothetical protein VLA12_14405, partial [Planctomycetaceae bacterium]|nr:hypothetical protein [Planctomycetaceae bacterium]
IACVTLEIGKAFAQTACKCGFCSFDPTHFSLITRESDTELVYWKVFPVVHYLRFEVEGEIGAMRTDWNRYQSERMWWRTLSELDTIKN